MALPWLSLVVLLLGRIALLRRYDLLLQTMEQRGLSVCLWRMWALEKWLNRSRCRLGCGLRWAQETNIRWGPDPPFKGGNFEGKEKERKSIYIVPFCTKVHTKRSGMDHTVLPANNTMPAFSSWRSPDVTTTATEAADIQLQLTTHLSSRKDERLSWPSWLTCSGWLTHISGGKRGGRGGPL